MNTIKETNDVVYKSQSCLTCRMMFVMTKSTYENTASNL